MKKIIQKITFFTMLVLSLCASAHAASNLLTNSEFLPVNPGTACDSYFTYGAIDPPSWTFFSSTLGEDTNNFKNGPLPNTIYKNDCLDPAPNPVPSYDNSQYFYDLGGRGTPDPEIGDYVKQTFSTVAGHKYKLTFGFSSEANGLSVDATVPGVTFESGKDSMRVQVGDQDQVFDSPYQAGYPNYGVHDVAVGAGGAWQMPWVDRSVIFTATAANTTLIFSVADVSVNNYATGDPIDPYYQVRNSANSVMIVMPKVVELAPTLTVNKALGGAGRLNATTDQFTVFIKSGGSVVNSTANSTTQGNAAVVTAGTGTTGVFAAVAATDYVVGEEAAAGSTTSLRQYSSSMVCVNVSAAADKTTFAPSLPVPTTIRLKDSDVVTCTITNAPGAPHLTIKKVSQGGVGEFHFKGTAANSNGFSTDNLYMVTTTVAGTAASGATVSLTATNALTEIQETVPAGWTINSATCVDANAASSGNTNGAFGSISGNTLTIPTLNVLAGADIQCTFTNSSTGFSISGKVLTDTGIGSGTAHDAIQNGSEAGHSGVTLSLTNCSGTVYSTTTSAADGSFSLSLSGVPAGTAACLVESLSGAFNSVSVNVGSTAGSYTASTTTLQFTPAANTFYSGVVLGDAPLSTFTSNGAQQTVSGQSVAYAHVYVAGSAGSVQFSTADSPAPAGLLWGSALYRDTSCNGVLDGADTLITSPIPVTAGQQVCILDKVNSPAGAIEGSKDFTTVSATETWAVPTLTPTSQNHVLNNNDTTTVSLAGLTLLKEVRKLSACPTSATASIANPTAYTSSGSARPGEFLEYRLTYGNNTAAPLTGIVVHDTVPVYTQYVNGYCLTLPSTGISSCAVSQQPVSGASSGGISWTLMDASAAPVGLQPLGSGTVSFCLQLQH